MPRYVKEIPKGCIELKSICGRDVRPNYYFYNPKTRIMYRRTHKNECEIEQFAIMTGDTFQPRLIKGNCKQFPKLDMKKVKDILSKSYEERINENQ